MTYYDMTYDMKIKVYTAKRHIPYFKLLTAVYIMWQVTLSIQFH